jgi:hypothetical protein
MGLRGRTSGERQVKIIHLPSALILRSAPQERVSKDAPGGSGDSWTILRDAAARLLRMRASARIEPYFSPGNIRRSTPSLRMK